MADGLVLNIDDKFLKSLERADQQMEKLAKTSEETGKRVINVFKDINNTAFKPFIENLNSIQQAIGKNSKPIVFKEINTQASQCMDKINSFIALMNKINDSDRGAIKNNAIVKLNEEIEIAKKRLSELNNLLNFYAKGEGSKAIGFFDTSSYVAESKELMKQIELLERKKESLQANARIRLEASKIRDENQNALDERYTKMVKQYAKESSDAAKAESKIYEERDKKHEQAQREYDKMGREMHKQKNAELAREYELQSEYNKRLAIQEEAKMESMRKFAQERVRLAEQEANASKKGQDSEMQKSWKEEIRRREQEEKAWAESVNKKKQFEQEEREARNKTRQEALNAANEIDKKEEALNKKRLKWVQEIDRANAELEKKKLARIDRRFEHIRNKERNEQKEAAAQAKRLASEQQQYLNTPKGALEYANNLNKGVRSINNMNQALRQLVNAQNTLNLNTQEGQKKYDELNKKIQKIKQDIDKATQSNDKFNQSNSRLLNTTDQLQRKMALLFSVTAIQSYMSTLVNVRKEFELQQKSLQVLLQNKDEADILWQQTLDLAIKSPFRVKELVSYTKQLAAYRIENEKLHDITKRLADVSAGLGVDMGRIILAFGQVRAANFLRGTELRQFTEAGIPMLDELANYFTELEGRMVSAGDVFARISKRMVTFGDVEEVFKRMTNAGGAFYQMQEEQSKTLHGMISNLHDSIDLMLNDIGRSNDGMLKDAVNIAKEMVDNWRAFATVLKEVGTVVAIVQLSKFITGWNMATKVSKEAMLAMNGVIGAGGRLNIAFKSLGKTLKAHPIFLVVGALASAGFALWEYTEAIDAANEQYDEMSRRELNRLDKLEELNKKVEAYNEIINDTTNNEKEKTKAQEANLKLLEEINQKYPELTSFITKQEDGTVNLTKAIERQNEQLRINIALQQRAKGGFSQDTLSQNYKEVIEAQNELEASIIDVNVASSQATVELQELVNAGELPESIALRFVELFKTIRSAKDFNQIKSIIGDINTEFQKLGTTHRVPMFDVFDIIRSQYSDLSHANDVYISSLGEFYKNLDNQMNAYKVGIQNEIAFDVKNGKKNAAEWVDIQLEALGVVDKKIKSFSQEYIVKKTGIELVFADDKQKEYTEADLKEEWKRKVWDAIKAVESTNPEIRLGVTLEEMVKGDKTSLISKLQTSVKNAQTENKKDIQISLIPEQVVFNDEQIKNINAVEKPLERIAALVGVINKESTTKGKDWWSEMARGIQNLREEYEELSNTLDKNEAKQMALQKHMNVLKEIISNLGAAGKDINLGSIDFTTEQGTIDALKMLKKMLPNGAKEARLNIEKALSDITGSIRLEAKQLEDEKLINEIEDMFSGYEMSIELQELNIPPNLAKQLFNVDYIGLQDIRKRIEQELESAEINGGEKDRVESLKTQLEKLNDLEDKYLKDRAKKYVNYLLTAQSERVKIKLKELKKIQELEKMHELSGEQKETIKRSIKLETQQELDSQKWEDFKNTTMYTQMFSDLEYLGTKSIQVLKEHLEGLKNSLFNLPASEVKEIMAQMAKLEEIEIERNPFTALRDAMKEVNALQKEGRTEEYLIKQLDASYKKVERFKEEIEAINIILESKDKGYALSDDDTGLVEEYRDLLSLSNEELQKRLNILAKSISNEEKIANMAGIDLKKFQKAREATQGFVDTVTEWGDAISNVLGSMDMLLESLGVAEDDSARIFLQSAQQIAQMVVQVVVLTASLYAMGVAANSALGVIGWIAMALQAVAMLFASIFQAGDKRKEKQIQRELDLVRKLERAYEDLSRAIEKGYSIDLYKSSATRIENMKKQQEAYERMIEAENAKKDTDKDRIRDWFDEIRDLNNEIEDAYDELKIELIGDFKSYSDELASAMIDALKAGEDGIAAWGEQVDEIVDNIVQKLLVTKFLEPKISELIDKYYADLMPNTSSAEEAKARYDKLQEEQLDLEEIMSTIGPYYNEFWDAYFKYEKNQQALLDAQKEYEKALEASKGEVPTIDKDATLEFEEGLNGLAEWFQSILPDWFLGSVQDSELSGLQRGIQGITEETAQILEAYLNSIRFFVAEQNTYLSQIAQSFSNTEVENPMVSQLKVIAAQTTAINSLLQSLTRGGHSMGGSGLKVFIS